MAPATNVLDHIIHLSPPGKLDEAVAHWESLGFKVIPGGQHADGLTSNALVSLADGVYIELIAFIHPPSSYPPDHPRHTHWWAPKQPGWIDWACLGLEDAVDETIHEREKQAESGVGYQPGQVGGRVRAGDGKELKWRVTFPERKHGRGSVPFFCQDLTPRELRVPSADTETHTNTALGISHIHLSVPADTFSKVKAQLSVVLDSRFDEASTEWELALPQSVQAATRTPRLRLSTARAGATTSSIDEVGFFVSRSKDQVDTPKGFGKVVFVDI
ncbi:hypothetical protein RhiJN_14867 [Ceratobasidium sp. AG-Ba]|nr:hypothetical protein RhiJN_14867 [Ceratobasidium sp. AG-Ba]